MRSLPRVKHYTMDIADHGEENHQLLSIDTGSSGERSGDRRSRLLGVARLGSFLRYLLLLLLL